MRLTLDGVVVGFDRSHFCVLVLDVSCRWSCRAAREAKETRLCQRGRQMWRKS